MSSYYRPAYIYGGPVESIHKRSLAVARLGHGLNTYTTDANGSGDLAVPLGQSVMVDGLPVTYFPRWWFGRQKKPFNLFFSPEMGKALQRLQPGAFDLILIHASFGDPGRMAAAAAKKTGTPYLCHTHGTFEPWAIHHKYWKKRLYLAAIEGCILNQAAGIVVCNEGETDQLRHLKIKSKIRRIPWGVEIQDPDELPPRSRLAEVYPTLTDRPFLLFLSRLHPKKGLDLLIPAFGSLAEEFPDWLLVLAGPDEGGYQFLLERMVRDLELEKRVIFTGLVSGQAKAMLLTHSEFMVLPSYSEGFPVAVAEALGYGLPVVLTTTCYMPEVALGGAGIEIPPEKEELTQALREMMRNDAFRHQGSVQARELACKHFTWEAVAKQSLEFYQEVIA